MDDCGRPLLSNNIQCLVHNDALEVLPGRYIDSIPWRSGVNLCLDRGIADEHRPPLRAPVRYAFQHVPDVCEARGLQVGVGQGGFEAGVAVDEDGIVLVQFVGAVLDLVVGYEASMPQVAGVEVGLVADVQDEYVGVK